MDKVNEVIEKEKKNQKEGEKAPVLQLVPNEDIGLLRRGACGVGGTLAMGVGFTLDGVSMAAGASAGLLERAAEVLNVVEEKTADTAEAVKATGSGWLDQFWAGFEAGKNAANQE